MKIKICGLKEVRHAVQAAEMGADFLGFVFAESPRKVTPEQALGIIRELPSKVLKVGVFVDEDDCIINETVTFCGLDLVQFHGRETPEDCRKILCPVIKGIRVKDGESLPEMEPYRDCVEMFLLDTYVRGLAGGTGKTFDWSLARPASRYGKVLLAGGLTPGNVKSAVAAARPFGVDVSSGVETGGIKDPVKIEAFIRQVRGREYVHLTG